MAADTTTEKRFLGLNGTKALVTEIKKKININVLTTKGDILYATSNQTTSNGVTTPANLSRLAIGTAGQVLKVSDSGVPAWDTDNDSNVSQNSISDGNTYNVLLRGVTGNTSGTGTANFNANVKVDTSTSTLIASKFSGNGASLTNLNATNLATGTVNAARLPSASPSTNGSGGSAGIISGQDLEHLQTMWGLWAADGSGDTIANKVAEILEVFDSYPEGADIADLINSKADASNVVPYTGATGNVNLGTNELTAYNLNATNQVEATRISTNTVRSDYDIEIYGFEGNTYIQDGFAVGLMAADAHATINLPNNLASDIAITLPSSSGTLALKSDFGAVSTVGSESITINGSTFNVVTRDTAQIISGAKTFYTDITVGNSNSTAATDVNILPARTEKSDLGSSSKKFNNLFIKTIGAAGTPAESVFAQTYDVRNSSGSQVATLSASGIKLGAATSNNNVTISWDTLALIANGEITAADVQAMF